MNIGDRIKEERARLGFSQTDFAALAGASKGSQISWEKGSAFPNAFVLSAWDKAGADPLYIIAGRREPVIEENEGTISPFRIAWIVLEVAAAFDSVGLTADLFGDSYPYSSNARRAADVGRISGEIYNRLFSISLDEDKNNAIRNMALGAAMSEKNSILERRKKNAELPTE